LKKSTHFFLAGIILILSACTSRQEHQDLSKKISWIRFEWEGDTIGGHFYDKPAMLVPFQLEGVPFRFTMQLDLGAPVTMVYGNTFIPLLELYPDLASHLDTVEHRYVLQGRKVGGLHDITFLLDTVRFAHRDIAIFEEYGDSSRQEDFRTDTVIHIGTVGADLFREKVLVIDFTRQRLALLDSLPARMEEGMADILVEQGRIKVPADINGKKVYLLYDTGSSFSSLYMATEDWDAYRDTTCVPDTLMVTAWGIKYPLLLSPTHIEVKIGNEIFHPDTVMANSLKPYRDFYRRAGILGLMGNRMFFDRILVIDLRNKRFGVIPDIF